MKKEIELKFKVKEPDFIREKLKEVEAKFVGKAFEKTIKFDTKNDDLKKEGKFLRVRTGFKNVITFKRKIGTGDKKFKEREEIELEISDSKKMEEILKNLGFPKRWIMEKYREKWQWGSAEIVIDRLPFGNFLEIEGNKKVIEKTAKLLGLHLADGLTSTYWGLWEDYRKKHVIKNENIIFKKNSKFR